MNEALIALGVLLALCGLGRILERPRLAEAGTTGVTVAVDSSGADFLVVTDSDGRIYYTADKGTTWTNLNDGEPYMYIGHPTKQEPHP